MLISFPFLSTPEPKTDDDRNDGTFGLGEKSGKGSFPVSYQFGWHGGVHLVAPGGDKNPEPVRAIADGEVVFARACTPQPKQDPTEQERDAYPLFYYAGWTSNGVVILKHQTEIGEGVEVVFYSIYQHLKTVANKTGAQEALKTGDKVYRKDPIGQAGTIYGRPNRIHFEIVADQANVEKLMGRSTGKLQAAEGRRNCVWGDMHIVLPAGTPMYAVNPRTETRNYVARAFDSTLGAPNDTLASVAQRFHTTPERILAVNGKKATDAGTWWPRVIGSEQNALRKPAPTVAQRTIRVPAVYGTAASTPPDDLTPDVWARWTVQPIGHTKAPLIVSLSEARGTITLTTRNASGEWIGSADEPEGAYKLYKTATDTYPGCPSAGYEMLRFGRILGPDAPAATDLHEGRLPHFRKVAVDANARAFVDLNRAGVKVYSDADFPHWLGWTFIDDDTDGNSRCDSEQLLDLIEPRTSTPHSGKGAHGTAVVIDTATEHRGRLMLAYAKTQTGELRDRLTYCVVKMPTEWARDDFDKRWGWLRGTEGTTPVSSPVNNIVFPMCLGEPAYQRFKRHHQALAFWEEAVTNGLGLKTEHYHFHPMRFIDVFKKCGWLSLREQAQLLPRSSMPDAGGANLSWNESRKRFLSGNQLGLVTSPPGLGLAINYTFRKYGFNTSLRQAHFLAQCFKESGALKWTAELGSSAYFRKMYEVYTPEEAASDFDNRREWLAAMGFLKGRGRLAYIAQRPQEIRDKALGGGNTQIGDGARFRGRGLIHLTWRNGYRDYGKYRNLDFTTDPNPERVQSDAEVAADTAGYFWSMRKIHSRADQGATNEDVKRCFSLVGGAGGLAERQQFFRYVYFILNDFPSMPIESGLKRQLEV